MTEIEFNVGDKVVYTFSKKLMVGTIKDYKIFEDKPKYRIQTIFGGFHSVYNDKETDIKLIIS